LKYLGNNHIGFDSNSLGFPSILGCQAIVYQTRQGLFGFHDMRTGSTPLLTYEQVVALKIQQFAAWVQNHSINHGTQALHLYGVINQAHQYSDDTAGNTNWRNMLQWVATALNFQGPIHGYRVTSHVEKNDSIYVRYDVNGDECTIGFKRWTKMDFDKGSVEAHQPNEQKVVAKSAPDSFDVRNPVETLYKVKRKGKVEGTFEAGEGRLNIVSKSSLKNLR
jgi:hypothetical protein